MPALRALAAAFPQHRRVLAAPSALAPLLTLIGPDPGRVPAAGERTVSELVPLPAWVGAEARPDARAAARLPRGAIAVNLHGRGPQSHRLLLATAPRRLIAFACAELPESEGGPPWERGADGGEDGRGASGGDGGEDGRGARGDDAAAPEHETARWCRLLAAHGIDGDPRALDLPAPRGAEVAAVARAARGATVLHAGAASAARRWPAERWAAVARAERRRGRTVLLTGSADEAPAARALAEAAGLPPAAVLAGRTDLLQLTAAIAAAARVVCGDTGVAHLATATGTRSVVLFGPVSPAVWGPPAERARHRVVWRGGSGDPHAPTADAGLLAIAPGEVIAALA